MVHSFQYKQNLGRRSSNFVCICMTLALVLLMHTPSTSARDLSLEEKIGQLLILGFPGDAFDKTTLPQIRALKPGAVIWFRRNIKSFAQIRDNNTKVQQVFSEAGLPPAFIMVDQEGGVVTRLRVRNPFASALALGEMTAPDVVEEYARQTGFLLKALGFNTNLAPVLDISSPQAENFLGHRVFGGSAEKVSATSASLARGLLSAHVLPIAKHFPGHGGIIEDSHKELPQKQETLEQLQAHDLVPFQKFADGFPVSGVMVAHIAFPKIDSETVPASFSHRISTDLIREKLKYQGLVVTDDLEMSSTGGFGTVGARAVTALQAGADMIMLSWDQRAQRDAVQALLAAVRDGRLSEARIDQSLAHIVKIKNELHLSEPAPEAPPLADVLTKIEDLTQLIAKTHFGNSAKPLEAKLGKHLKLVRIFSSDARFSTAFSAGLGKKSGIKIALTALRSATRRYEINLSKADLGVYYVTGQGSARLLRSLPNAVKQHLIVINGMYPGLVGEKENYFEVINLYSSYPHAGVWLGELLKRSQIQGLANAF